MRRIVLIILAFIFLPNPGKPGSYNSYSNLAYCSDRLTCLHETAHAIDDSSGWISQSPEFELAVGLYLQTADYDETYLQITHTLMTTKQNQMKEVYAWFFAYSDGDIEKINHFVRPYYNEDTVNAFLEKSNSRVMIFWGLD